MKLVRFIHEGKTMYGDLDGDKIAILKGSAAEGFTKAGTEIGISEVRIICPVMPSKIICVGLNYIDHIEETGAARPEEPRIFMKPPTAVIGPGESICRPPQSERVDYEGELAIVIGRNAKNISRQNAHDYIFGYTCANDVTARDLQSRDGQWTRGKGFDTFLPLGPCIVTDIDASSLPISTLLNGKTVQSSNTDQLLFTIDVMVEFVSSVMTLYPGDVILTGTSSGIGPMNPGDTVTVRIDGIGELTNPVV